MGALLSSCCCRQSPVDAADGANQLDLMTNNNLYCCVTRHWEPVVVTRSTLPLEEVFEWPFAEQLQNVNRISISLN
ncbi:TPA_asm: hypothetical protein 1 [Varicolored abalone xenomavirus]|nr:TPA_asm: hypothetical protein 1 [Varicolored abalone xenomavirus]